MLKNEEGFFVFSRNGESITEALSKDEALEFLEELFSDFKKYSIRNIEDYLDELIEVVRKSRISGFKLKPMLRKYLGENKGIHPYTGRPAEFNSVRYLNSKQRNLLEIQIKDGKIIDSNGKLFDSLDLSNKFNNGKAIFVMDDSGKIFASTDSWVGEFHHSSFLGGNPVAMAGEIEVFNGILIGVNNSTRHYRTKERHMKQFLNYIKNQGVDINVLDVEIIR